MKVFWIKGAGNLKLENDFRDQRLDALEKIAQEADKRIKHKKPSAKRSFLRAVGAGLKFSLDKILVPTAKLTNYAIKEALSLSTTTALVVGLGSSPELRADISEHFQQAAKTYSALIHESPRPHIRPDNLGAPLRPEIRPTR